MSDKHCITVSKLAHLLNISCPTLILHLRQNKVDHKFSQQSDGDLDILVMTYQHVNPASGLRYLAVFLCHHGLWVQKWQVFSSVHRVDGLGHALHHHTTIQQCQYRVLRPNALWHVHGHHKLILWGIVIHGMVDGYSWTVSFWASSSNSYSKEDQITSLHASDNNRAGTILNLFLDAIGKYGLPSHMHGDYGHENKAISLYMILCWGLNWGSFIWGS